MPGTGSPQNPEAAQHGLQLDAAAAITFASFRLDLRRGQLFRGGEPVALRPKTWSVLRYLAQHPGVLIAKNDLLDAVWADLAVTESVLSKSIGELRVALGDSFKAPRFIETVQRRGFRFIAPVGNRGSVISHQSLSLMTAPFVGRAKELQRLATLLAKARGGER